MKKLISSGKDAEYSPDIAARIEWACVKQLYVLAVQYEAEPRKWDFIAEVVFHDDTFIELPHDRDITTARQLCARLSAIHDKPVVDWTRPAPSGLTLETFREDIARYMADLKEAVTRGEREEKPKPPVWGLDGRILITCSWTVQPMRSLLKVWMNWSAQPKHGWGLTYPT